LVKRKVRLTIGESELFMNGIMDKYYNRVTYAYC